MQCTHERVSLVHVDVPDATTQMHLVIEVDRLHEYTRAPVVQEHMLVAHPHKRQKHESAHGREFGEGQLGPRSEVAQQRVLVMHCCGKCPSLRAPFCLVRRRMGYRLALASDFEDEVVLPATEHAAS